VISHLAKINYICIQSLELIFKRFNMLQSIIAALIVLVAFVFVLMPLFTKKKPDNSCNTCSSGGCGGCPISEVARNKNAGTKGPNQVK